jgi:large conductance mechanosensitive channel
MPPVGVALGGADFKDTFLVLKPGTDGNTTYATLEAANAAGASTWRVGLFLNAVINFLIIGFVVFMIVRAAGKAKRKEEAKPPTDKDCPKCLMKVPIKATKCGHCTSDIE